MRKHIAPIARRQLPIKLQFAPLKPAEYLAPAGDVFGDEMPEDFPAG